jgi:LmbE family N-acetylglucosaminyl deacetylase
MVEELRLLCVFAHPDDESMGMGSTLARYAAEGVGCYLVTATRGERGWMGDPYENPGMAALGRIRTEELRAAGEALGLCEIAYLDYIDGDLDLADLAEATERIVTHLRRIHPQVVVTFGPDGSYGHPDHIAISQLTTAALVLSADATYTDPANQPSHRVSKLYYVVDTPELVARYTESFGGISITVDGVERSQVAWPDWAITTRIDGSAYVDTALRAIACHASQLLGLPDLQTLTGEQRLALLGVGTFYRASSLVSGGRRGESDLFEGIR